MVWVELKMCCKNCCKFIFRNDVELVAYVNASGRRNDSI